jgi:signal transduction histidine kinase
LLPVLLLHAASTGGAALARLAPRVLGPTRTERMAAELAAAHAAERALAERNRLARELHDSVGHALTITTLQAGAAARVLHTDPAFVATALDAIAEAGRAALADLDHVLGLLRDEGGGDRAPQPDLGDLDALVDGARSAGVPVELRREGATGVVPRAVSREAYRIVQEGFTNALRHAGPVPVDVRVTVTADAVELELTNPLVAGTARHGGGRGIAGMRERVSVLRGELSAGPDGGRWRVAARLPVGPEKIPQ